MFFLNDFNLVCCALATVSAAVGYHAAKRRNWRALLRKSRKEDRNTPIRHRERRESTSSSSSSYDSTTTTTDSDSVFDCPPTPENACDETEPGSLKRKNRSEEPEDVVDCNLGSDVTLASPPRKRCKTPPVDLIEIIDEDMSEVVEDIVVTSVVTEPTAEISPAEPEAEPSPVEPEAEPLTAEPEAAPSPAEPEAALSPAEPEVSLSPAAPEAKLSLAEPEAPQIPPKSVHSAFSSPFVPLPTFPTFQLKPATTSSGFAAFASSGSAFAIAGPTGPHKKPAWCSSSVESPFASAFTPPPLFATDLSSTTRSSSPVNTLSGDFKAHEPADPLAAQSYTHGATTVNTGEEDEEVVTELRGAKVYIKRGQKEFTDGILGHLKLLAHRDTQQERLLFRREPVWKVSMSVRLRPVVRCAFDEEQGVLRVTLKEAVEQEGVPSEKWPQEVVVYALKRGKTPKSDFAEFARRVVGSSHLRAPEIAPL